MKKIRIIKSKKEIKEACGLLYQIYIEKMNWVFDVANPSFLRIEHVDNQKFLVDDFTDRAIWFGVFEDDMLVGCARLQGMDDNKLLDIERYKSSEIIHHLLPEAKNNLFEITKFAMKPGFFSMGVLKELLLYILEFCEQRGLSVLTCTHYNFLKRFYKKIGFSLKMEKAFKYYESDLSAVNLYVALHENGEIKQIIDVLEKTKKNTMSTEKKLLEALEIAAPILPLPIYWHNKEGKVLGINGLALKGLGASKEIVGKTPYEFYSPQKAKSILAHHNEVMRRGEILIQEEKVIDFTTKEEKYFSVIKGPLYDEHGEVIGIIGTGIDITAQKQAEILKQENERLEIENRYQNQLITEQNNFREIINQAVHDIRSPLASLLIISRYTKQLPLDIANIINAVTQRISDISDNLLAKYNPDTGVENVDVALEKKHLQISLPLQEILSEKKYEFYDRPVEFKITIDPSCHLAFLWVEEISFKRMISNLINNAVEAVEKALTFVSIHLSASEEMITVTIEDNGRGMSFQTIDKIMNNIAITEGKERGHGIGFSQIRATLQKHDGILHIDSVIDQGTKISLSFPKTAPPEWVAEKIEIHSDDIVIVLDDDQAIHQAWKMKFKDYPRLRIKYFSSSREANLFLGQFSETEKENILLLADYELVEPETGLEVIKKNKIKRSLLVTNRFSNKEIQNNLMKCEGKMLSKLYLSEIPLCNISREK